MAQVGVKDLKAHTSEILRRVREEGEVFEITYRGETVAQLTPAASCRPVSDEEIDQYLAELDALAADIGKRWPKGVSAVDAVNDVRREL